MRNQALAALEATIAADEQILLLLAEWRSASKDPFTQQRYKRAYESASRERDRQWLRYETIWNALPLDEQYPSTPPEPPKPAPDPEPASEPEQLRMEDWFE